VEHEIIYYSDLKISCAFTVRLYVKWIEKATAVPRLTELTLYVSSFLVVV